MRALFPLGILVLCSTSSPAQLGAPPAEPASSPELAQGGELASPSPDPGVAPEGSTLLVPKRLAAPPEDFPRLRLPDPARAAVRSSLARHAVRLERGVDGSWEWEGSLLLEEGASHLLVLAPPGADWEVFLGDDAASLDRRARTGGPIVRRESELGLAGGRHPVTLYALGALPKGERRVRVRAADDWWPGAERADGYLFVAGEGPLGLATHFLDHERRVGRPVGLVARLFDARTEAELPPAALLGLDASGDLEVTAPDGMVRRVALRDDGRGLDVRAGDGLYTAAFTPRSEGPHRLSLELFGRTPTGERFRRSASHTFHAVPEALALEPFAEAEAADAERVTLRLHATPLVPTLPRLRAAAELWGLDASGSRVPVAWVGGVVRPLAGPFGLAFELELDGRWLARAGVTGGLELRAVRLSDADHHAPVARAGRVPVLAAGLPASAVQSVPQGSSPTRGMLMGRAPAVRFQTVPVPPAERRLLLVHGYCSSLVWPAGQFTQAEVFQDLGQNRTHDEFAQLIGLAGAAYTSFGVVGHSQGGAAALHLYATYWSGLDEALGGRRIQSVGTPYQGTALAGNLAVLGDIFGAGCGVNTDLTYDGASMWLAGIPSWARAEVHYYTTSFFDGPFLDNCHFATDFFLTDPEDGTTERWAGQLAGGQNRGHVAGWCHTTGMSDPPQYLDGARNQEMDLNASR